MNPSKAVSRHFSESPDKEDIRSSPTMKFELVLRVLRGESAVEVCRENTVSLTEFSKWRDAFLRGAHEGLTIQLRPYPSLPPDRKEPLCGEPDERR